MNPWQPTESGTNGDELMANCTKAIQYYEKRLEQSIV